MEEITIQTRSSVFGEEVVTREKGDRDEKVHDEGKEEGSEAGEFEDRAQDCGVFENRGVDGCLVFFACADGSRTAAKGVCSCWCCWVDDG